MKHQRRIGAIAAVLTTVFCAVLVACRDDSVSPPEDLRTSKPTAAVQSALRYTPDELHSMNRMDWVGKAHHAVMAALIAEMMKGTPPRQLCARLTVWLDAGELEKAVPQAAASRDATRSAIMRSALCTRKTAAAFQSVSTPATTELSQTAQGLISDVESETAAASDPTDLASRLSPIVSSASSLGAEEDAVLSAVAIAQSSYEEWYDGSQLTASANVYIDDMEPCLLGQMENEQRELDGQMYQCQGSEWHMIRRRIEPAAPFTFKLASATVASCAPDPLVVYGADLAAGAAAIVYTWFVPGWNAQAVIGATVAASAVAALAEVIGVVRCFFGLAT